MHLEKQFSFDAAHFLPTVDINHKCRRLHGHRYDITITLKGDIDPAKKWIMDFADVKEKVKPIIERLDHQFLNAIPGLENPTAEVISKYIFDQIKQTLPILFSVRVNESATSSCVYFGD